MHVAARASMHAGRVTGTDVRKQVTTGDDRRELRRKARRKSHAVTSKIQTKRSYEELGQAQVLPQSQHRQTIARTVVAGKLLQSGADARKQIFRRRFAQTFRETTRCYTFCFRWLAHFMLLLRNGSVSSRLLGRLGLWMVVVPPTLARSSVCCR